MGNDADFWPLGDPLKRANLVELIRGDGQIEPTDVELVVEVLVLGLLSYAM